MKKNNFFKSLRKYRYTFLAYLLMMPTIIIMTSLVLYPISTTLIYSLRKMKLSDPSNTRFIGLDNYISTLSSESFWFALQNSLIVMVLVAVMCCMMGISLAVMINVKNRLNNVLIAISILPWALPPVVNALLWRLIFYSGYGFFNKLLINLGLVDKPVLWLSDRGYLLAILSILVSWRNIPFSTIVFLSAIRTIPKSIYEAARLEGANTWEIFMKITLPILIPAFAIVITFTSISAINVFDEVVSLSGYSNIAKTLLVENYIVTFSFLDFGLGSSITYIIMIMVAILAAFYIKSLSKRVEFI